MPKVGYRDAPHIEKIPTNAYYAADSETYPSIYISISVYTYLSMYLSDFPHTIVSPGSFRLSDLILFENFAALMKYVPVNEDQNGNKNSNRSD